MNQLSKRALLWIHNPFCFVCGNLIESYSDSSIEHIVPRSRGGTNAPHNLAVSHQLCNRLKSDSLDRNEWLQKLENVNLYGSTFIFKSHLTQMSLTDADLLRVIKEAFHNLEFVQINLRMIPHFYNQSNPHEGIDIIRKPVKKLTKLNLEALISASKLIDGPKAKNYWRLIFGILFLELYQKDFDQVALLHALWRLDTYKKNLNKSIVFWPFADILIDICKDFEPTVFEKYENLIALKSQAAEDIQRNMEISNLLA